MEQQFTQEFLKKIVFFSSPILNNEARRGGSSSLVCFRGIVLLFDSSTENGVLQLNFDRVCDKNRFLPFFDPVFQFLQMGSSILDENVFFS